MAAFSVAAGPLEREATHLWSADPPLLLNHLADWPRFEILGRIEGLHDRPDADDDRYPAPGRIGEVTRPGLQRGRALTYPLRVLGRDLLELRLGQGLLAGAFADAQTERFMFIDPAGEHTGPRWFYIAKPIALTVGDEAFGADLRPAAWQIAYTLTLRLADPRYSTGANGTTDALTAHMAGDAAAIVENLGNAPADPVFEVQGPTDAANHVELRNQTTGDELIFHGLTLTASQRLVVDFRARTARLTNGTNMRRYLRATQSTWWDAGRPGLPPGSSTVQVIGAGDSDVSWHHASWG